MKRFSPGHLPSRRRNESCSLRRLPLTKTSLLWRRDKIWDVRVKASYFTDSQENFFDVVRCVPYDQNPELRRTAAAFTAVAEGLDVGIELGVLWCMERQDPLVPEDFVSFVHSACLDSDADAFFLLGWFGQFPLPLPPDVGAAGTSPVLQPWRIDGTRSLVTLPAWIIPIIPHGCTLDIQKPSDGMAPAWEDWAGRGIADRLFKVTDKLTWEPNRSRGDFRVKIRTKAPDFQKWPWVPGIHQLLMWVGQNKQGKGAQLKMAVNDKGRGKGGHDTRRSGGSATEAPVQWMRWRTPNGWDCLARKEPGRWVVRL